MSRLIERVAWAHSHLERVEPQYRIIYEYPEGCEEDKNGCVAVMSPAPEWMAMALHGGLLPPPEVYDQMNETMEDGKVTQGWLMHETEPLRALTEEEAMEYLVIKDVPKVVREAHARGNRAYIKIVRKEQVPSDRSFRNAWRMKL